MKNLKICRSRSVTALKKLNEAVEENGKKKYVFQGVFTACSTPEKTVINRNNRSYPEREVLKHLSYLRDAIKQQGSLLGELDHPEGRFDIQLKEASHKITDLWYDTKTHCVMGKLELLDTPNGKIAKELVDAGYPLFVSSRAAGDVDEKTHEVEIAQIFTYDIVCTPGFAEARLEKVNESIISANAINFVNETIMNDMKNDPYKIALYESDETIKLNERALASASKPIKLNSLTKPLLEEDDFTLPEAETDPTKVDDNDSDKDEKNDDKKDVKDESPKDTKEIDADKDDISEDGEDDEKEEKRSLILGIQGEDKDGEVISADNEASEDESEDTSDMREKILNISAEEVDDSEDDKSDDKDSDTEDKESDEDIEECNDRKNKVSADTDKTIGELEDLLLSVEKTESVRESIIRRYPFTISLSEDNFGRFAALRPQQKKKCNDFIVEHQIFDIQSINELWTTPLQAEKRIQKNWLKLASQRDIDLYVAAPKDVQDAIEESAKYLILETQEDVNRFWQKTGLRQAAAKKMQAEKFVNEYKTSNASPYDESLNQSNNLGYSDAFINMIGDLMAD